MKGPLQAPEKIRKELARREAATAATAPPPAKPIEQVLDIWGAEEPSPAAWESGLIPVKPADRVMASMKVRKRKDLYKPAAQKHSEFQAGNGISYNPDTNAHEDLLGEATAYEIKRIKEVKKWENVLRPHPGLKDDDEENDRALDEMVTFINNGMRRTETGEMEHDEEASSSDSDEVRGFFFLLGLFFFSFFAL